MSNWNPNAPGGQGGFGQQPPQQGGYGQPQQGYGYPGGQQGGFGSGGPGGQRPKKSNGMIIGIVIAGVAVLALIGVAIGLFVGGDKDDPVVPQPTPPPTAAPTSPGSTTNPPTTSPPTTTNQTPAGAIELGQGMSVKPASGWTLQNRSDDGAVLLRDGKGRLMVVSSGSSSNPQAEVENLITTVTESATDVRKTDVQTLDVHPSLSVAVQHAVYTVTGQSGTDTRWSYAIVSQRTADGIGFAAITLAPASDINDEAFTSDVTSMVASVIQTQLQ